MKTTQMRALRRGIRESAEDRVFNAVVLALLTLFGICTLYPLIYVLSASFSEPTAETEMMSVTPARFIASILAR